MQHDPRLDLDLTAAVVASIAGNLPNSVVPTALKARQGLMAEARAVEEVRRHGDCSSQEVEEEVEVARSYGSAAAAPVLVEVQEYRWV